MPDQLYFFSGSADKPVGKGVNEYVENPQKYVKLNQISNWRRKLSNFWVATFECNGRRWNTVEHMFQAYKFNDVDPDLMFSFSIDSGSELSQSNGDVARSMRKRIKLNNEQLDQWNKIKDDILYQALIAKFSQHPELARILILTGDAELWHGAPRVPKKRQYILEAVRTQLIQQNN